MGSSPSKTSDKKSIISEESENPENRKHDLPDFVFEMLKECLYSLPMPPGRGVTDNTCQRIARHVERLDIKKQTDILNKGDKALGIFIVVRGEAEVVSQNGKDVIATISEGDYFGEISVLFKVPCTARVRVPQKAILLFLPVEKANKVLHRVQIELQEYYKLRKYMHLDADTRVDQTILQTEIAKEALKQVPMLESWSDESLSYIISNIAKLHNPIVLYPTNSCLIHQKDPSREICILVRGKVSVVDGKKVITTIDTKKSPICVGEEGLFTNTDRAVTFKTLTVCHVIKIDKAALIETIHKFELDAGTYYSRSLDSWMRIKKWKSRKVYNEYAPELQLEVIMQKLWSTLLFSEVPVGFIYMIAMTTTAYNYSKDTTVLSETEYTFLCSDVNRSDSKVDQHWKLDSAQAIDTFNQNQQLFLLVHGEAVFVSNNEKILELKDGDVFWNSKWLPTNGHVKAIDDTLLLKFTANAVQDALKYYPTAKLILPQKPSELISSTTNLDQEQTSTDQQDAVSDPDKARENNGI